MTNAGTVTVEVEGRDVNLVSLLQRVDTQMRATDQAGLKLARTVSGPVTAAQQRAANSAIAEAQAMARAAVAVGDNARAHQILVTALGNSTGASDRAVAGLTAQIGRLQSGKTLFTQFGAAAKSSLEGIIGPAALAGGAIAALGVAMQETEAAFRLKAGLDETQQTIRTLIGTTRDSSQVFQEAASFGQQYAFTQREVADALQASTQILKVSNASTQETLETLSRLAVLNPGEGISGAAFALRELASGDITSLVERFNLSRDAAYAMRDAIRSGQDPIMVLSQFLDNAGVSMDTLANRTTGAAGKMRELAVEGEKFQLALAGGAGGPGLAILEARIQATRGATRLLSGDIDAMGQSLVQATASGEGFLPVLSAIPGLALLNSQAARDMAAAQLQADAVQRQWASGMQQSSGAALQQAEASGTAAEGISFQSKAMIDAATAAGDAAVQNAVFNATLDDNAQKAAIASAESQILNAEQRLLEQAAMAAANGMIAGSNAAAVLAGQFNITTAEADQLIARMRQLAQLQNTLDVGRATQSIGRSGVGAFVQEKQTKELQKDVDQVFNRIQGGAARHQAKLTKTAKGGGAARLSDQQKLNNQLLAQQERADDQAEQAEREHQQRLLDIDQEFARRQAEAVARSETEKRGSRASFYRTLLLDTEGLSPQIEQQLSAAYEEAFAKSQELARQGHVEQANEYLKLKQDQIEAEAAFQAEAERLRKEGDKEQLERLNRIRDLERQAEAEQEKQLLEGGDPNVQARLDAISEEEARNLEAQQKIADASANAAERKINNALRSKQAIDAENAALATQEATLNRIGGRAGVVGGPAGTPVATTPTAAPTDLAAALSGLRDAIAAVERATSAGADKVARAVSASASARLVN